MYIHAHTYTYVPQYLRDYTSSMYIYVQSSFVCMFPCGVLAEKKHAIIDVIHIMFACEVCIVYINLW